MLLLQWDNCNHQLKTSKNVTDFEIKLEEIVLNFGIVTMV